MSNHLQLFDKFAKLVFTFSPETDNQIALKFSDLTSSFSTQPETFAYCESNTWRLVATVARAKNMTKLTYTSLLKQWVAKVPNNQIVQKVKTQPLVEHVPKRQKTVNNALSSPSNKRQTKEKYTGTMNEKFNKLMQDRANTIRNTDAKNVHIDDKNLNAGSISESSNDKENAENQKPQLGKRHRPLDSSSSERPHKKGMTKNHLVDLDDDDMEKAYKEQLEKLRYNDFTPIASTFKSYQTHCQLYNTYCEYQTQALKNPSISIPTHLRAIWKQTVKDELQKNGNKKYKRALYEVLAGNEDFVKAHFCNTWEDIMWINLNKKLEDMLDDPEKNGDEPILSDDTIVSALSKDAMLTRDDPRTIFHQIQTAIINGNMVKIFEQVFKTLYVKNYKNLLKISEDQTFREHLLRFLSTLIVYGIQYLDWQESRYSTAILNAYADMNSRPESMRPHVVAAYACKRTEFRQKYMYSNLLQNCTGDDDHCKALIAIGDEYKLDMPEILVHTFEQLYVKERARGGARIDEFINALKWVIYDRDMAVDAVECAKKLIDYAIKCSKPYIIEQVNATLVSSHVGKAVEIQFAT